MCFVHIVVRERRGAEELAGVGEQLGADAVHLGGGGDSPGSVAGKKRGRGRETGGRGSVGLSFVGS